MEVLVAITDQLKSHSKNMYISNYLFSIILILFVAELCLSQGNLNSRANQLPKLSLKGEVEEILIEQDIGTSSIKVKLNMTLKNESGKRIIFLDYPIFFPGRDFLAPMQNGEEDKILVTNYGGYSCQWNAENWIEARNSFKNQKKPNNNVYFLDSEQEKLIHTEVRFIVANEDSSKYVTNDINKSLETLLKISSLRLRVIAELYPSWGMEPKCKVRKLEFGRYLRNQWKDTGYLWLNDITSEPIPLNLRSAIIKKN